MDYEEFKAQLEKRIKEEYPDCNLLKREDIWSIILSDEHIGPAINMSQMYFAFKKNQDKNVEGIIEAINKAFNNKPVIDEEQITNWDKAKEILMCSLMNKDNVSEARISKPFTESIIQVVRLDLGDGSIIVSNQLAKIWGKSEDEILEAALNNAYKYPATIETMGNVMMEAKAAGVSEDIIEGFKLIELLEKITPPSELMYVVSNERGTLGATAITYEAVINQLEEIFGGNFYIIPSSIHEVMAVKENPQIKESLKKSIIQTNGEELPPRDVLCWNIIKYDVKTKEFSEV